MKRRILSILIALALMSAMMPSALAAQFRETEFFTDQYHTELHFDEMAYRRIDVEPLLAEADAVGTLLTNAGNLEEVTARYDALMEQKDELGAMTAIAYIRFCQDYTDTASEEAFTYADQAHTLMSDKLSALTRDILNSPCVTAADKHYTPEEQAELLEYKEKTEEQLALEMRETELINRYWTTSGSVTVDYEGRTWSEESVYAAYESGELEKDTYKEIRELVREKENEELGAIFLEMIDLRREIAALDGYDNYTEYAYKEIWERDFTPQEIRPFHTAVKEHMAPLTQDMGVVYDLVLEGEAEDFVFGSDYSGEIAVETIAPYFPRLSDELTEAFTYMRSHGLYDLEKSDRKQDQGFCINLDGYGASFIYNKPYGGVYDLQVLVHEFGHYNNAYWADPDYKKSSDICEVHSQGLELLFTEFYPEIFGEYADAAKVYLMDNLIYGSIVNGARLDELQQYAYATENVTLEQLNREYCRLSKEYGFIDADDPREELGTWVDVHHLFDRPCEYICYAVSAAGGFAFWLEAQEDYFSAVDHYLELVALDTSYGFQSSFDAVEMQSPISPDYVKDLAETLRSALKVDEQIAAAGEENDPPAEEDSAPEDTVSRESFVNVLYFLAGAPAVEEPVRFEDTVSETVAWAAAEGIVAGYGDGTFRPEEAITRAQAVTMLWRFARYAGVDVSVGEETNILSYEDAFDVAEYAIPAMQWACGAGLLQGKQTPDGKGMILDPAGLATQEQIADIMTRFIDQL